jgi:hypothetical protein
VERGVEENGGGLSRVIYGGPGWQTLQRVQERGRVIKHHRWRSNSITRRQLVFGQRAGIYFLAREVILEGKWIVRPATMNTPSPW